MVRVRVRLTEKQYRRLRRWANRLGVSLSEAVRRCVAEHPMRKGGTPSGDYRVRCALAVCGKYADPDGPSRVAPDHDRNLVEAYRR